MSNQAGAFATDHSTIMTNPMHAERALAYDVPVGVCSIKADALRRLRVAADWRLLKKVDDTNPLKIFKEYFNNGTIHEAATSEWVKRSDCKAKLPSLIIDKRQNPAVGPTPTSGEKAHG